MTTAGYVVIGAVALIGFAVYTVRKHNKKK